MRRKLIILCMAIMMITVNSFSSQAAIADALKWATSATTYNYSTYGSSNFVNAVQLATADWSNKTDFNMTLSSSGNIYVDEQNVSGVTWAGICTNTKSSGFLSSAYIIVNKTITGSYHQNKVRAVVCHELGHAIGLAHEGVKKDETNETVLKSYNSIMLPTIQQVYDICGFYTPQITDIADVNSVY